MDLFAESGEGVIEEAKKKMAELQREYGTGG